MVKGNQTGSSRISVLESQVETLTTNVVKIEEKIDSNYATLHRRISEMRDDFHTNIEDKHEKVIERIDEQAKASSEQHSKIAEKIHSFENWRWMLIGAAAVVGYFIAHIKLEKLF